MELKANISPEAPRCGGRKRLLLVEGVCAVVKYDKNL